MPYNKLTYRKSFLHKNPLHVTDPGQKQRDRQWTQHLQQEGHGAFEALFRAYADRLCSFAAAYVGSAAVAEDLVQSVFCDLWNRRRGGALPEGNVKAYLFRAVRNKALNRLKHRRVEERHETRTKRQGRTGPVHTPADTLQHQELRQAMREAVEELPERRRLIYRLARRQGLSYKEIAAALEIAPKTVENQMGRALKTLRERLAKFASVLQ